MTSHGTLIAGAGQAAAQAAMSLRQAGYEEPISLVGEENLPPYHRPPLSKAWLAGDMQDQELSLRPDMFWESQGIDLTLGVRVDAVDLAARRADLSNGRGRQFNHLILATGARVRELPVEGASLDGVHYLRSAQHATSLRKAMKHASTMVVIGGGYVGLECAATAKKAGLNVTVLEAESRILSRVAGAELAGFFTKAHQQRGVDIRLEARLQAILGKNGAVHAVQLEDGSLIKTDLVVIGIGVIPNQELAENCGIVCQNGILVDAYCQTSEAGVFAIGDVASHPNKIYNRNMRLESVHNAIEQGKTAALHIAGKPKPYNQVPWFWSDQFDLKLQIAGISQGADQTVIREEKGNAAFAVFYLRQGKLIAVDAVNSPAEYMASKMMIGQGKSPDPGKLQNISISMKEIILESV